ncbi:MAG TPA: hypothetical protein PK857_07010 [Hyphomicrobium sp.]|nr:hypothetical protein [Hyphomicrobium sp.]HRO50827.1 hypothetical protein [Hyphomicrobium sp.]
MILKAIATAATIGLMTLTVSADAEARSGKSKRVHKEAAVRDDCKPYNGPFGYYGNPWCENGWKYADDYAPGTSPYLDLMDLPQLRRLERRRY